MITYDVNLCIGTDEPNKRLAVKCHDTGVNLRIHLRVCRHGKWKDEFDPYNIPAGSTAVLRIVKPDKKYCITDGTVESNAVFFELPSQAFTAPGISSAEVSLFAQDGKRITSATFNIDVPEECICGCDLDSENYIDVMSEQIRAAIEAANRAEDAVAHGPIIQSGTWWLWNPETGKYEDSGVAIAPKVDDKYIKSAIDEFLAENPLSEKDPTVPEWAKQPNPPEQPNELPNPHKLTFTGAAQAEYDGSKEVTVEIPKGGSGGIPIPETAEVGQTIVVKAVDENGKPTEWEAAELLSGMEMIYCETMAEAVSQLTVTKDRNGESFSLLEATVLVVIPYQEGREKFDLVCNLIGMSTWDYINIPDGQVWTIHIDAYPLADYTKRSRYQYGTGMKDMTISNSTNTVYEESRRVTGLTLQNVPVNTKVFLFGRRG